MTHDFREELDYSNVPADEPFWQQAYKKAFPVLLTTRSFTDNMAAQKLGIDRVAYLPFKGKLRFDEKKRRKDYGDILVEYVSNDRTGAPGWVEKPLKVDFISYAFMPTQRVLFIPFGDLQIMWFDNKQAWLAHYGTKSVPNKGYNTLNVPVPEQIIKCAMRVIEVRVPPSRPEFLSTYAPKSTGLPVN